MKKSPSFALIFSFHKNWYLQYLIHLRKNQFSKYCYRKRNPTVENKFYLVYNLVYISDSMDEFRQLSIWNIVVSSWSKFLLKGTGLCYQLDSFFLIRAIGLMMGLWSERCFVAASWQSQHLSVKKNWKKVMRSKWSLIRHNCVRKYFWSDPSALKEVMIRPNCGRSGLWSDKSALEEVMIRPNCARSWLWSDLNALESAYDQTFQTKPTSDQTISRLSSRL